MKTKRRILSLLLCASMIFTAAPINAFATEGTQDSGTTISAGGLCEHHPEHNETCGYAAGTTGTSCIHEHTEDCYIKATSCVHEHDESCYPGDNVSDNDAAPPSEATEPTACVHVCSTESGCITEELNCTHAAHDSECGYVPETPEVPCGYVCVECTGRTIDCACISTGLCTPNTRNENCGVCVDDLSACKGENLEVAALQERIAALPDVETLEKMSSEEQKIVSDNLSAANDAYGALNETLDGALEWHLAEEKAKLNELSAWFNSLTANGSVTVNDVPITDEGYYPVTNGKPGDWQEDMPPSGGYIHWNGTNTLTLNNAAIEGNVVLPEKNEDCYYYIVAEGNCSIAQSIMTKPSYSYYTYLSISGDGPLKVGGAPPLLCMQLIVVPLERALPLTKRLSFLVLL